MSKPVIRTYRDTSDLKRMQKLTQDIWTLESNYHIGIATPSTRWT